MYYPAIRKKEILTFTTLMDLEGIMIVRQMQVKKKKKKKVKFISTESRKSLPGTVGWEKQGEVVKVYKNKMK